MRRALSLLFICLFFFLARECLPQNEADWSAVDLTYKASPRDTVDWSNIDLTQKPPAPGVKDREWPGEQEGISGPVIAQGKEKRNVSIVIFDPCGVPVGYLRHKDSKRPGLVQVLVEYALLRGKEQFLEKLRDAWWLGEGEQDLPAKIEGLNKEIKERRQELVSQYGEEVLRIPKGFRPETVVIIRQGLSPEAVGQLVQDIARVLGKGLSRERFEKVFFGQSWVYAVEPVFLRRVQEINPDDPLYLRAGKGSKRRRRKGGIGLLGIGSGKAKVELGLGRGKDSAHDQWGIRYVGYRPLDENNSAWGIESGEEENVVVAVIDSGLDTSHPDGPAYLWKNKGEIPGNGLDDDNNGYVDDVNGWNFLEENTDLTDYKGHGTFVAGIIAAKRDNGIGIAGINPGARIMALKVADKNGVASSLGIWRALHYAADKGAKVINISLGGKGVSKLEQLGINHAYSKGALVVVAGGNQAGNSWDYGPPAGRRAFVVGALNIEGTRSVINNQGPNLAVLAPGEDIYSLHSKDAEWKGPAMDRERLYFKQSGTSFSAPIVAATASLIWARNPGLTNSQIEDIILATTRDMDMPGWDSRTGAGVLDAYQALLKADDPSDIITVLPTEVVFMRKKGRLSSLDLFGVIRGPFDYYEVYFGRGKSTKRLKKIAGPFKDKLEYGHIVSIDRKYLRGSAITIQLKAYSSDGSEKTATLFLNLKKPGR